MLSSPSGSRSSRLRFQIRAAAAGLGREVDPEEPDDGAAAGANAGRERHLEAVGRPGRAVTAVTHGPVGHRAARSGRDCQREDGLLQQQAQREQDGVGVEGGAGEHGLAPSWWVAAAGPLQDEVGGLEVHERVDLDPHLRAGASRRRC